MTTHDALLGPDFPLPLTEPFTFRGALDAGITRHRLRTLLEEGLVRRLLPGIYVAAQEPDSQLLRARAIGMLVPRGQVVVDESAGWLHGAEMILAPGAHQQVPPLAVFGTGGAGRLRNGLARSGTRGLTPDDVTEIHGVLTTTPVRTALDLGRLRRRDRALAAMDQLLRLGAFTHEELLVQIARFRGFRGVRQLRVLAPIADGRSESPGESALRLRFHDACLPSPTPQLDVYDDDGLFLARADLAIEEIRFIAEYDGERWHGAARHVADRERVERLEDAGWVVRTLRRDNLFGPRADAEDVLREGVREARRRLGAGGEPGAGRLA